MIKLNLLGGGGGGLFKYAHRLRLKEFFYESDENEDTSEK